MDSIDRSHVLLLLAAVFLALHLGGGRTDQGPARRRIPYPRAIVVVPALGLLLLLQLAGPVSEILRRAAVPAEISPGRRSAYIQAARVICPWNYHVEEQCFDREWDNLRRTKRRTAFEAAERHLRRALRLNPRDPGLHRKLGRFYATLPPAFAKSLPGLKDRIRQAFHEADRLDPLNVVGRYNGLVKIYYPDHPQAFLRKAAILHRLPCGFARLDLMEGLCYQKTGDPAAALDRFRRARAHYEASRRALERLPRGSLIRAFHGFNVSGFPLDTIQQKIDSLEHALQEPKRERSQRKP